MADPVLVGVASIPEREASLHEVVAALSPQCQVMHVSLNRYPAVPAWMASYGNVVPTLVDGDGGGDAEKFAAVDDWDGYVVTCDDDIGYPRDYVADLLAGIARHTPATVVGYHGGTTLGWNGSAVAASHKRIRCLGDLAADDTDVNVMGTGVTAYDARHVPVWRDVFRHAFMADVQFACHLRTMGARMAALRHQAGWLTDICPMGGPRIYEAQRGRGDFQHLDTSDLRAQEIRRFDWTRPAPGRPRVRVSVSTCGRPWMAADLLADLAREARWVDMEVGVYEDPAEVRVPYTDAKAIQQAHRHWTWTRFPHRLGRLNYWQLVDRQMRDARQSNADWYVFLPDDVRLVRHAIPRAISTWLRLTDPATLTLWRLQSLEGKSNWTGMHPVPGDHDSTEIFHVDGCYLAQRPMLEAMRFRCTDPQHPHPTGSGVGRLMSRRLHKLGHRMYRVDRSLVVSAGNGVSIMNPDERLRHPTVTL